MNLSTKVKNTYPEMIQYLSIVYLLRCGSNDISGLCLGVGRLLKFSVYADALHPHIGMLELRRLKDEKSV